MAVSEHPGAYLNVRSHTHLDSPQRTCDGVSDPFQPIGRQSAGKRMKLVTVVSLGKKTARRRW